MIRYSTPQLEKAIRLRKAAATTCKDGTYIAAKIYDRDEIARLLSAGLTVRGVAHIVGCSTWPVQVVKKQMKQRGLFNEKED